MTFKEFMKEVGYDLMTTFWEDFSIADKYGIAGVKDTYRRAFNEWKDDYKFFTELTLVLNHKIWQHYESNRELAALYDRLWREADEYAMNNFKGIKGIAYVTKEKYDNEVCNKEGDWKEDCAKIIDNEVKSIGMWMWGDVKGYVLEKKVAFTKKYKDESREDEDCEEWEEVDSCWGCYEETDELIKEVMIENGLEE